jgi:hypothetical protein
MESELYRSVVEKGEARTKAETILRILLIRMGALDPAIPERSRGLADTDLWTAWYEHALHVVDVEGARWLAETTQKASITRAAPWGVP